ncbi:hypothetical protein BT63DRAFT_479414 [Microthyrium microscopicum]|uniref:DUF4470 domain-containing protein n=1 Tax=Microthyrium microscopicum TaxID=703497 RepID=A0A6A6UDH3_9PEZI|nr:hypothetical protein BT63DRAFT_479414 [Microthyrium microscopicum]
MAAPRIANPKASSEFREAGNALYKAKNFSEALLSYKNACEADMNDFRPPSNMAAVFYESGNYTMAVLVGQKTLLLMNMKDEAPDSPSRTRLLLRIAQAQIHLGKYAEALQTMGSITASNAETSVIRASAELGLKFDQDSPLQRGTKSVMHLPRYKVSLDPNMNYFPTGHDQPLNLFKPAEQESNQTSKTDKIYAVFLGGIGDARHLYETLGHLAASSEIKTIEQNFHFTVNDISPEILARDMIFWLLLDELSLFELSSKSKEKVLRREVLQFSMTALYVAQIVPAWVDMELDRILEKAISVLEGYTALPTWICFDNKYRPAIIQALKAWQTASIGVASTMLSTELALAKAKWEAINPGADDSMGARLLDEKDFSDMLLIYPPEVTGKIKEPELSKLIKNPPSSGRRQEIKTYLRENWKTNRTLIHVANEANGEITDLGNNPFFVAKNLVDPRQYDEPSKMSLYDFTKIYFQLAAHSIRLLKGRFTVEVVLGETTEFLEDIRWSKMPDRDKDFPVRYDGIHLSNIPDYIGGSLSSFLFGIPILKVNSTAEFMSTCVRNPPNFPTIEDFNNEYIGISEKAKLVQVFPVHGRSEFPDTRLTNGISDLMDHYYWRRLFDHPYRYEFLLSQPELETWLIRQFLKIVLPYPRKLYPVHVFVYSPLNGSVFFRILRHLHSVGYPAHWLKPILASVLSNEVQTTARPPRSCPLKTSEPKKKFPLRKLNLAPFMAEFRTLASLWKQELPFAFESIYTPQWSQIRNYTITMPGIDNPSGVPNGKNPNFILVFFNTRLLSMLKIQEAGLHSILLDDEKGSSDPKVVKMRETGMCVVQSWKWDPAKHTGSFWMDEAVVSQWKDQEEGWSGQIYRDDIYAPVSKVVKVADGGPGFVEGETWAA